VKHPQHPPALNIHNTHSIKYLNQLYVIPGKLYIKIDIALFNRTANFCSKKRVSRSGVLFTEENCAKMLFACLL